MSTKLRSVCLAAVLTATTATALSAGAGTASADTRCTPTARIFTMQADGDLWLYEHAAPNTGEYSWAGAKHIGNGWGGKTFAGTDGRVYNITTGGELRRLRYNGTGWDVFPNGRQYEAIGSGWQKFVEQGNRDKITVDADGSIYTLEDDLLRWWQYDEGTRQWAPGSGQTLDRGLYKYNAITASGSGGLQFRESATGELHRYRYHRGLERFVVHHGFAENTWSGTKRLLSAGGDIYYAVSLDTGQLLWNRFAETGVKLGWEHATGRVIGSGWGTDVDVTAITTDCSVTGLWQPTNPVVQDQNAMPTAIVQPASGGRRLVNVHSDNEVTELYETSHGWVHGNVGGKYAGISREVVNGDAELFGATKFGTGDVELRTLSNGQWQGVRSLRGGMETAPSIVRRTNGTLIVYSTSGRSYSPTAPATLQYREQQPDGQFLAWRPVGFSDVVGTPTAASRGGGTVVVALTKSGQYEWYRHSPGLYPSRQGYLPHIAGKNAKLVADSQNRMVLFDVGHKSGSNGLWAAVLREKPDQTGFENSWTFLHPVPGTAGVEGAQLDAQLLPNGSFAVSVTANSGKVYATTSYGTDNSSFHPWQLVSADAENVQFTDPTSMRTNRWDGSLTLAAVQTTGSRHLFSAIIPADPINPLRFSGGPVS
ncbi:hypothetical protein FKR81_25385 [Lentzea tibetensis]|uniref:Tachylectin n=1 Tax=Lentzea tibetensis TaxID=2591470 RepID=A0A563EP82_9PSEU|nr:tachylectin-related carbohydrate-binding protein [Lentzea tibetensis]TWP49015.1 hypothetical protein FKR81_25385 [Lentzea tibetensis]